MRIAIYVLLVLLVASEGFSATITSKIGGNYPTDRHYSTPAAWEADAYNSATGSDDAVGEMYADGDFTAVATLNDNTPISVTLRAATGERHDGTANTGVRIINTSNDEILNISINGVDSLVEWIEFDRNGGNTHFAIIAANNSTDATIKNCLLHGTSANKTSACEGILVSGATTTCNVLSCFIFGITNSNSGTVYGIHLTSTNDANILNTTIHDIGTTHSSASAYGLGMLDDADHAYQNDMVTDVSVNGGSGTAQCYELTTLSNATCSYNLASDTSASGTGSLDSKTSANQFVSTTGGSEDLHLKTGADAIDAGTDLGTSPSGIEIDIDAYDRTGAATWDMGAHEFIAGGVTFVPKIIIY